MTSTHLEAPMSSPTGEALALHFRAVALGPRGWLGKRSPPGELGGLLTLAFYHLSQGATIVAVLIIICTDWIIRRMTDQLLVRRWLQMLRRCDVRHRRHTSIYIHILLQQN
jgi:O-antigen ligase